MTIQGSDQLVSHLFLIEKLVCELRLVKPSLSDQEAFMLAKLMLENVQNKNCEVLTRKAS